MLCRLGHVRKPRNRDDGAVQSKVVKQADLVFALYACGDRFDAEQKARDFDY